MKTRFKFTKTGTMKFIGHLDCMRFFQKAIRRANLDVSYSQGFNPHQIMSFAAPLSVGATTDGDVIDIQFESLPEMEKSDFIKYINGFMTEEIFINDFVILPDDAKTSMSLLERCDYMISFKDGKTFSTNVIGDANGVKLSEYFTEFMGREEIIYNKKTKRSFKEIDIKPYILHYAFDLESFENQVGLKYGDLNNEYDSEEMLYLQLTSGSVMNLKPDQVLDALCQFGDFELKPYSYQVHRMNMYFRD
ncbi:TIGR03936 family radical SAM-associated protein [Eubacterium xylanophilum]|uniref:TIGR03936 family radical SAM-associated protein n=1 Tax=Eubacterium xylanophilum TaxID=39497 RepID=UPI0004B307DA|nr:TIGR03936 family radical SAM-associated protein [Eubacterium xylanophilum]MCR5797880.1 TIGR03936 family radical SAM-associated protein [Eubacterium sp.]